MNEKATFTFWFQSTPPHGRRFITQLAKITPKSFNPRLRTGGDILV